MALYPARHQRPDPQAAAKHRRHRLRRRHPGRPAGHRRVAARQAHRRPRPQQASSPTRTPGSAASSPAHSATSDGPGSAAPSHCRDPSPSDNDQTPHAGPPDLAADASRSPSSTRPPRSARPQTAKLKIIFFSIAQKKVISPNDFASLDELAGALLAFVDRYNQTARPFNWKFTATDLARLLDRISAREHAAQNPAKLPEAA